MKTFKHDIFPFAIGSKVTRPGWGLTEIVRGYIPCNKNYLDCAQCLSHQHQILFDKSNGRSHQWMSCSSEQGRLRWVLAYENI